jgi:hypothetical protein
VGVLVALLAGIVTTLFLEARRLWAQIQMLEQTIATLASTQSVEEIAKNVEDLKTMTCEGFSKSAEVMNALNSALALTNATVRLNAVAVEKNYIRRAELN